MLESRLQALPFHSPLTITAITTVKFTIVNMLLTNEDSLAPNAIATETKY